MKIRIKHRSWLDLSYIIVLVAAGITIFIVQLVYVETQNILKERLREKLTAIAATAALQFSPSELERIQDRSSIGGNEIKMVTEKLKLIRESNNNLQFIYILRPTSDPLIQTFIADADTLAPLEEIDENGNGILDDEENPPQPGDEYDSSELPAFLDALEGTATADYELNTDQWGTFISGYAPIMDEDKVVAVLGIDVEVSDFYLVIRATLFPFILQSVFLVLMLLGLTVILTIIWRNRVEIVKEIDRQKDELLGIIAHQLATPITSIRWKLEEMNDGDMGKLSKEQAEEVQSMQSISANLTDLVSMILDVSRIQLGRMKVEKQELELQTFFREIVEIIEPKAKEKGVKFKVDTPKTFPKAMLDKRYTHMTIENLLSNAVKYTPSGGSVEFKVSIKNNMIICTVKDSGVGIPIEDQDKIFGKLFRASNVRNSVDGNGFGLYVAKGAVEAQGGSIRFTSKENAGTTFFVELPLN